MHIFHGTPTETKQRGLQLLRLRNAHLRNRGKQYVVFFDIDDTLLNAQHSYYRASNDYLPPILPIIDLYRAAEQNGLKMVIITARPDTPENRRFTQDELRYHKLRYDLLYLNHPSNDDIPSFKRQARLDALKRLNNSDHPELFRDGIAPLFAVGDRQWDMGEYGGTGLLIDTPESVVPL
jgi:hypothetical protein